MTEAEPVRPEIDADRTAQVLAEAIGRLDVAAEPRTAEEHLRLVAVAAAVEAQSRALLAEAVASSRAAGVTWAALGGRLGMSKQAVQKRFASRAEPSGDELDDGSRVLGPVTAFTEMGELAIAGRHGWHSVEFGPLFHRVVRSPTQWEHARVSMLRGRVRSLTGEGWVVIGSAFPYTYLKRDLGTPALAEDDPPLTADR
ncbi:hypothetical protein [uncultured Pseudokineococcus sp.]|uniref:hypothetical protein n=1 Tax=uncultured Pseudokineococcus sp. TaxID=1642928 RepID=UPI002637078D|nr:hypothetical protein [uncultured Pseudokineococcus sp.]